MNTNVEMLEDGRAKITVTIEAAQVDARIASEYKKVATRYNFPGFRKGKAPRRVIDSAMGSTAVTSQVTGDMIEETCALAIDGSGLFPVGEPEFSEVEMCKDHEDYTYSLTVSLRKEFELSNYEPVAIEMPVAETTDADVTAQLEELVSHYSEYEDAAEGAKAEVDSRIVMDMKTTDDKGEELATLTTESFQYTIGSGLFPADFDEKVTGAAIGDEINFTMPLGENGTAYTTAYMGKTENFNFAIKVTGLKVKKAPEITDEWVSESFGFETVEELRSRIADSINAQKEQIFPAMKENRCLDALVARFDGEVDDAAVDAAEAQLLQDFFGQLQQQGMTLDAYLKGQNLTSDQFKEDVKKQAADMVKQNYVLDSWARHFELEATDGDVEAEFIKSGSEDWEALYEDWKKAGRIHDVREGILRGKALDNLVETAVVTEVSSDAEAE